MRRIDQQRDAPFAERTDLRDRGGHRIGSQRNRRRMKIAARMHDFVDGEHQRVVADRIGLALQHLRRVGKLVQAGAHHLRQATQAVRVLHARVIAPMRLADAAAGKQFADRRRNRDLPELTAQ